MKHCGWHLLCSTSEAETWPLNNLDQIVHGRRWDLCLTFSLSELFKQPFPKLLESIKMKYHLVNRTFVHWFKFGSSFQYSATKQFVDGGRWDLCLTWPASGFFKQHLPKLLQSIKMRYHWVNGTFMHKFWKQFSVLDHKTIFIKLCIQGIWSKLKVKMYIVS